MEPNQTENSRREFLKTSVALGAGLVFSTSPTNLFANKPFYKE